MRIKVTLLLLLFAGIALAGNEPLCRDPKFVDDFLAHASGTRDFSPAEINDAFRPFVWCLQRWVEDGGAQDSLPVKPWAEMPFRKPARFPYMLRAMQVIDELVLNGGIAANDTAIPAWIMSSVQKWPEQVRWDAYKTLVDLKYTDVLPLLRQEARQAEGLGKNMIWELLAKLSPQTLMIDVEPLAKTEEDYKALGFAVLKANDPAVIPLLQRLVNLDPGKGSQYLERIKQLQAGITWTVDQ